MKTIDIIGDNYFGYWNKTRTACRGIIIEDSNILLSYEIQTDQWMIPGGGIEINESDRDCCIREIAEETGKIVEASECMLEIDEYRYFICRILGTTEIKQTKREQEVGMVPKWIPLDKIIDIFSNHNMYADTDEMRRGMYLREYTALKELVG